MADIANSLRVATQIPLDEKLYFKTTAEAIDLSNNKPYSYYEGMIIFNLETKIYYIWKERQDASEIGLISFDFEYAANSIANGIDYSGRNFNFMVYLDPCPYNGRLKFTKCEANAFNKFRIENGDFVMGDIDGNQFLIGGYYTAGISGNPFAESSYDPNTIVTEVKPVLLSE